MSVEIKTEQFTQGIETASNQVETPSLIAETQQEIDSSKQEAAIQSPITSNTSTIQVSETFQQRTVVQADSNDTSGDTIRKIIEAKEEIRSTGAQIPVL